MEQRAAAAQTNNSSAIKPAEEALRRQRETFQREQRAAFLGAPSAQTSVQSPQSQRSLLKEAQMNRQDSSAAQSRAAPAPTSQNYGSAALEGTLGYLNQNGVGAKYTQELSKAAQSPVAQSQTAQLGQRLGSAALEGTLGYLNQNGVSTRYTQGLTQPQTAQNQTTPNQTAQTGQRQPAQTAAPLRQTSRENQRLSFKETQMEQSAAVTPPRSAEQIQSELQEVRNSISRIENSRSNAMPVIEAQAAQKEQLLRQKERLERELTAQGLPIPEKQSIWDRAKGAIAGGAEQWYSGQLSATGGLAGNTDTIGRYATDLEYEQALQYRQSLQYELEDYEAGEIHMTDKQLKNLQEQIKYYDEQLLPSLSKGVEAYDTIGEKSAAEADRMSAEAAEKIDTAKEDLGLGGQIAVDVLTQGTQMLLDRATGAPRLSMFTRMFGYGTQEARQSGADWEDQAKYGLAVGTVETLTESVFDGLAGLYGAGAANELTDKVILKLATSDAGQKALKILFGAAGEGAEEMLSDALNPMLRTLYSDKSIREEYSTEKLVDWLYDGLIGSILGAGGTSIEVMQGWSPQTGTRTGSQNTGNSAEIPNTTGTQAQEVTEESTSVNTDPSKHTPEEQARIEEYQAAVDENFVSYIENVQKNPGAKIGRYSLKPVAERAAADIKRLTGIDVSGNNTTIESRIVEHIIKDHGPQGKTDHSMSDINDIARIQYVLDNYDDVEYGGTSSAYRTVKPNGLSGQAKTVIFRKAVNGTYYVVEAVPDTKAKTIFVVTAYMSKKKTGDVQAADADASRVTSETKVAQSPIDSIPSQGQNVNDPLPSSLTNGVPDSILNPYLKAYYNYLNSATSDAQNPSPSLMAPVSEDELIGRYFDEAWDAEGYISPL